MRAKKMFLALAFSASALFLLNPMTLLAAEQGSMNRQDRAAQPGVAGQPGTAGQSMNNRNQAANQQGNLSDSRQEAENTVRSATQVLKDIQSNPQQSIPKSVLQKAAGIAIVPNLVKAGLIAGGRHGTGVLMTHNNGHWSPPAFISISGGSLGAQIGVETTDLILVFNDRKNISQIVQGNNWTVGADASVAGGPSGAKAKASTQQAAVLTYKRTSGLFAGATVTGATIGLDQEPMMAYYDLQNQNKSAAGYYPNEQQMAEAILKVGPKQNEKAVQKIPESARKLDEALQKAASK